ncbi:MAG: hypothetical protein IJJ33_00860 [Victivallales bacterium]|nr:hypothetical protein [Victivallales bacterium]
MKKIFLFLLLFALGAFSADRNAFSLEADKKVVKPGETIELKITAEPLEGYQACAWYVLFNEANVPQGAAEALGKKYSKAHIARIHEAWFAKDTLAEKERTLKLKVTDKWAKGDYKVKIQLIFRQSPPNVKTDKYVMRDLLFTVE